MGSPGHPFRIALIWHPSLSSHPRSLLKKTIIIVIVIILIIIIMIIAIIFLG